MRIVERGRSLCIDSPNTKAGLHSKQREFVDKGKANNIVEYRRGIFLKGYFERVLVDGMVVSSCDVYKVVGGELHRLQSEVWAVESYLWKCATRKPIHVFEENVESGAKSYRSDVVGSLIHYDIFYKHTIAGISGSEQNLVWSAHRCWITLNDNYDLVILDRDKLESNSQYRSCELRSVDRRRVF